MLNEVWSENFTLFCRASDMINVSSKTPFWYQHSEREREKEGRWILGITNTCIYLSCCWTIKCAPNNKNKHREYSLVLYCMEIVDFRTLYLLVTWSFLCWCYSMVEEWSVLSLIISFQGHLVHIFFFGVEFGSFRQGLF